MTRKYTTAAAGLVTIGLAAALFASCGQQGPDTEVVQQGVEPTRIDGNPSCGDFNENWIELRVDASELADGTYSTPDGYLDITISNYDGKSFDWTSTEGLDAVFVKGGPGGNLYEYIPEALGDTGLNAFGDKEYGVSHVSFCYDVEFARISIAPNDTNEVGDPHTFTVLLEEKIGFGGAWVPAVGDVVTVSLIGSNGAVPMTSMDTCAVGTDANGECTVTFSSNTAGLVTGTASSDVDVDGSIVHVETDGTGENSAGAIKRYVDASITIAPSAVNEVGDYHTFTVTVQIDDGNGSPGPPPTGTDVDVLLASSFGAMPTDITNNCDTDIGGAGTDAMGQCTVMFRSDTPGTVTATASTTVIVYGVPLTRTTDGLGNNSGPAAKRFVDAYIQIEPDDTNDVGAYHTFTVTARQNDGTSMTYDAVPTGTSILVTLTGSNGAVATDITDDCNTGTGGSGTNASGQCTVMFRSDSAGLITGHASMNITIDGVPIMRETDGLGNNSDDAVKRYVDAWIAIAPDDTNGVGEFHTFTVTAKQDDGGGSGFVNVPDGTLISVSLDPMGSGAVVSSLTDNCGTLGTTGGTCTVTFTSLSPGSITANATMNITVASLLISRTTDGIGNNSGPAVKTFVDGTLRWLKVDEDGAPLGGATFEVCRTALWNSTTSSFVPLPANDVVCVLVTDNLPPDADPDPGEFQLDNQVLGLYALKETIAPSGYNFDPLAPAVILAISVTSPTILMPPTFVNTPDEEFSGCTPGFWKNHTEFWNSLASDPIAMAAGFDTSTKFNTYFGLTPAQSGFSNDATMEDAINAGGGGQYKLARHAVAALLNAASPFAYPYEDDVATLKALITAAFVSGVYEPIASDLNDANNYGCLN